MGGIRTVRSGIVVLAGPGQQLGGAVQPGEGLGHLGADVGHLHDRRDQETQEEGEGEELAQREPVRTTRWPP